MPIYTDGPIIRNDISLDDFYSEPVRFIEQSYILHFLTLLIIVLVAILLVNTITRYCKAEANKGQRIAGILLFYLLAYVSFNAANEYNHQVVTYLHNKLPPSVFYTTWHSFFLNFNWELLTEIVGLVYFGFIALYVYVCIKSRRKIGKFINFFWVNIVKIFKRI